MSEVLASRGLAVGDIVTYECHDESSGGIVFQICENCDPVKPAGTKPRDRWSSDPIDENGKVIPTMRINGYVRLRPVFTFFPSEKGKNTRGKGNTLLLYHSQLGRIKKVGLVDLGAKYMELGNIIRELAVTHGMEEPK